MADIVTIPVARRTAHQTQITTLDGRPFRLSLDWNQRISRWFLSVETAGGDLIARKALVLGADLLRQARWNPSAPQGALIVADTTGTHTEPSLDSLGGSCKIFYITADE